ncbi:hypothetical protein CALCODRAFT_511915 [Calocera cornea HHB12733]|uniref:Transcriptional regulator of RNA polII, SAGA, subunit-domain-containing protein n=1 Tax=Calocera cornea HHB12733 TaxID=1353952 RepID=A0A165DEW4_9BASI|nr:hypothetical protein CALCODRAFT_511915 [Calocera cornea HHB12733]
MTLLAAPSSSSLPLAQLNPPPNPFLPAPHYVSPAPSHLPHPNHAPGGATPAVRTQRLKAKLNALLGREAPQYWSAVTGFLTGRIMRGEMDAVLEGLLKGTEALALHNAFLLSILRTASLSPSALAALSLPPPGSSPTKKRKRVYPPQGALNAEEEEEEYGGRSKRMREWVVGMGRWERERLKGLERQGGEEWRAPEVGAERGVRYIPGSTSSPPLAGATSDQAPFFCSIVFPHTAAYSAHTLPSTLLSTHTRSLPAAQVLQQRLASIALSRGLPGGVSPDCVPLLTAALESHLKALVARGLSLTQRGLSFASIRTAAEGPAASLPTGAPATSAAERERERESKPVLAKKEKEKDTSPTQRPLGLPDLRTLLTIAPSELPAKSASTVALTWADPPLPAQESAQPLPSLAAVQGTTTGSSRRDAAARQLERLLALRSGVREEIRRAVEGKELAGAGVGITDSVGAGPGAGAGGGAVPGETKRWEEHDRVGEWIAAVV